MNLDHLYGLLAIAGSQDLESARFDLRNELSHHI